MNPLNLTVLLAALLTSISAHADISAINQREQNVNTYSSAFYNYTHTRDQDYLQNLLSKEQQLQTELELWFKQWQTADQAWVKLISFDEWQAAVYRFYRQQSLSLARLKQQQKGIIENSERMLSKLKPTSSLPASEEIGHFSARFQELNRDMQSNATMLINSNASLLDHAERMQQAFSPEFFVNRLKKRAIEDKLPNIEAKLTQFAAYFKAETAARPLLNSLSLETDRLTLSMQYLEGFWLKNHIPLFNKQCQSTKDQLTSLNLAADQYQRLNSEVTSLCSEVNQRYTSSILAYSAQELALANHQRRLKAMSLICQKPEEQRSGRCEVYRWLKNVSTQELIKYDEASLSQLEETWRKTSESI